MALLSVAACIINPARSNSTASAAAFKPTRGLVAAPRQQQRRAPCQQQRQWRRRLAAPAAGRGGGPGRDSESENEDFFAENENSVDDRFEAMDEEEFEDTSMRLYLDSANVQARGGGRRLVWAVPAWSAVARAHAIAQAVRNCVVVPLVCA